jgi:hypothetical protein
MTASALSTSEFASVPPKAKIAKIARYGWILRDSPGVPTYIDKHELNIDHAYQREKVSQGKVRQIQSSWSWVGCGMILVALRKDGTHWVMDGQHRVLAARNRSDIDELPCLVFTVESKNDEAAGFLVANTQRKPVTAIAKYRAMVLTKDATAIAVDEVLNRLGIEVSDTLNTVRQIKCVTKCLKVAADSKETLYLCLRAYMRLDNAPSINSRMLDGLAWLHKRHGLLSNSRFVERFSSQDIEELHMSIRRYAAAEGSTAAKVCAAGILTCVNKGLRNKFCANNNDG